MASFTIRTKPVFLHTFTTRVLSYHQFRITMALSLLQGHIPRGEAGLEVVGNRTTVRCRAWKLLVSTGCPRNYRKSVL